MKLNLKNWIKGLNLTWGNIAWNLLGSAILAFGLYNVHALSGVTEGGILGLTLLCTIGCICRLPYRALCSTPSAICGDGNCWESLSLLILLWQAEDFPYSTRFLNNFRRCGRSWLIGRCWRRFWARCSSASAWVYVCAQAERPAEMTRWP